MNSDPAQVDKPLSERQVLEAEYLHLRGRLPCSETETNSASAAPAPGGCCEQQLKAEFLRKAATDKVPLSALCLSGGGIRSATFNLGVLQALAKHGLLERMDYLSTVSGGGYIGSWLTSWIHRHPRGAAGVFEELKGRTDVETN